MKSSRSSPTAPSLEWLQILDYTIHPLDDRDGRRWWVTDEKDTVSLQVFPGGLKEGVDTGSLEALREMVRPKRPEGGLSLVSFRMVKTNWLKALEVTLRFPQSPGDTFVGQVDIPFPDFTFVIEAECPEHRDAPPRATAPPPAALGADPEDSPDDDHYQFGALEPEHPLPRLRRLLHAILAGLRVAPELRRCAQIPLPEGELIRPARELVLGINDEETVESLRGLVGLEFEKIVLPQIHLRASDGGVWFPNCSIPLGDGFLVLESCLQCGGIRDTEFGMLGVALRDRPLERFIEEGDETRDIPPLSSISIALESAPIEAIQLYERLCLSWAGDEEFLSDMMLIIHRRDGIEARVHAYANGGDLQFSLRLEPDAAVDKRYTLRWDSRW